MAQLVASNSRGPVIGKKLYRTLLVNCIEKTKIKKKRPGMAHFLKKNGAEVNLINAQRS